MVIETVPEKGSGGERRAVGGAVLRFVKQTRERTWFGRFVRGSWEAVPGDECILET